MRDPRDRPLRLLVSCLGQTSLECLSLNRGGTLAWQLLFGPLRRLLAGAFRLHASSPLESPSARMSFGLPLFRSPSPVRFWRWTEVRVYQARRGLKTSDH